MGDDPTGTGLIEAYEQLRAVVLDKRSTGGGLGAGLLMGKGIPAWAAAWRALPPCRSASPPAAAVAPPAEVVAVLASMALCCIGR